MNVKVTIIIPTYKSPQSLDLLLKNLSSLHHSHQLQVICINNIKKMYRAELVYKWTKLFYDFKYINADLRGVNSARNIGIKYALGDILWFLDDDCRLTTNIKSVDQVIELHEDNPNHIGIGGFYIKPDHLKKHNLAYFQMAHYWFRQSILPNADSTMLLGGSASYKRAIFDQGLLFDSDIKFGGSERYFNEQLIEAGLKLKVDPTLNVYHDVSMSFTNFLCKAFKQGHTKAFKKDNRIESKSLKRACTNKFYQKIYMITFNWGQNQNLPLREKVTISIIDIFLYQDFIPLRKAYHYLIPHIVFFLYTIRNCAQKPYFKIYHVSKYHIETYLMPILKKMRKRI
jgi:glycosyltransferase involved in cell wall biosynthesis